MLKMRLIIGACLLLLLASPVMAIQPTITAVTVGTTDIQVLPASPATGRYAIYIDNESTTASIACAFGTTIAALNTAGSFTIAAGKTRDWAPTTDPYNLLAPSGPVNCIASAVGTPVTIETLP